MPDKWDQFAQPAASGDKWEQYASPDPLTAATQATAKAAGASSKLAPPPSGFEPVTAGNDETQHPNNPIYQELARQDQIKGRAVKARNAAITPVTDAASVLMGAPSFLTESLPSSARAGAALNQVTQVAGQHTIPITNELSDALQNASRLGKSGRTMPKVVSDFINRTMDMSQPPINFDEARDFYSAATSKMSPDESMKMVPAMRRALGQFSSALGESLNKVADQAGVLDQYRNAMKEYHNAQTVGRAATKAIKYAPWVAGGMAALEEGRRLVGSK